jgi:uncharacterized protein (TIGR00255 family)
MPIRSMTGFAQVKGQVDGRSGFTLSLKSVNHRFLDLHFRLPSATEALEIKLRRLLKERLARGHVEVTLTMDRGAEEGLVLNRVLVGDYLKAFRTAAAEFEVNAEPDLNAILRLPGAMEAASSTAGEELEAAVLARMEQALEHLNQMREEEGRGMAQELRERMQRLRAAASSLHQHRTAVLRAYVERLQGRMKELIGMPGDPDRLLQEAALLVDRSDIQEELVRLDTHVKHFEGLLDSGGEVGKKLDFLLQEMSREANTLLSKTSGLAGEALKITELGLAMKAEIEKAREQVQNLE